MNQNFGLGHEYQIGDNPLLDPDCLIPLSVLHLEDNDIDAAIFKAASLRCSKDLLVKRVTSIEAFKHALEASKPHLICADHLLPDGSGIEALRASEQLSPNIPFIVITGAGQEELAVDYLKAGAVHYLSKKKLDLFPEILDQVLKNYRANALHTWSEIERQRLTEELLALIRRVAEENDEEKRRLSRDIHDQLGQELTALKLGLFWIENQIRKAPSFPSQSAVHEKIEHLLSLNTSIIEEVRDIAHALRPVVLDHVGLSAGLETLVQDFNRRESTFCGLNLDPLPELSENLRTDVFRIVQEALTNISRHAEANLAYISLKVSQDQITLEIGDDGKGMPKLDQNSPAIGLGLVGMRERARNHGAHFTVTSQERMGTSIVIEFRIPSSL